MIAGAALLAGMLAAGWLLPHPLAWALRRHHDPVSLILWWLLSMTGVLLSGMAGVVMMVTPVHAAAGAVLAALHQDWGPLHQSLRPDELIAGAGATLLLSVAMIHWLVAGWRQVRRRIRRRRENIAALRLVADRHAGSPTTLWLRHEQPLAFSIGGRSGLIVATDGLTRALPERAVAAVLAHERAHLRGRHHLIVALADLLGAAAPFVPLFRQATSVVRVLVELAADEEAARHHGAAAVRTALAVVSRTPAPGYGLGMAGGLIRLRLAHLDQLARAHRPLSRALARIVVSVTAVALPFLVGVTSLMTIALICTAANL
ncbi:M56 family metallopeptidase [Amycolatopsis tucumanensis]|uniref:M56 family metallopeptidase n=1 Tax=Amycolatopsis tucumanensis TaxID=401106 RepID=A0ABP7JXJ2_9PSEU|nr:M56 family metallopeptidase [Amycolatopsis tucumanensis]MCF6429124.1 M56 family metallopeptidase [Amycolatopsis tucumanensis]